MRTEKSKENRYKIGKTAQGVRRFFREARMGRDARWGDYRKGESIPFWWQSSCHCGLSLHFFPCI